MKLTLNIITIGLLLLAVLGWKQAWQSYNEAEKPLLLQAFYER